MATQASTEHGMTQQMFAEQQILPPADPLKPAAKAAPSCQSSYHGLQASTQQHLSRMKWPFGVMLQQLVENSAECCVCVWVCQRMPGTRQDLSLM
jgi:hypothetical protein